MTQTVSPLQSGTRILMFIHTLELGGSEKQCVEAAILLAKNGYSVTIGCLRPGPLEVKLRDAGVDCIQFPIKGGLLHLDAFMQFLRLIFHIRKNKYRVVHTHDLYSNLFAVPAAWLARVPVILSSRRDLARWWWYTPARRKLLGKIQSLSTRVLVNSEAVRQELITRDGFAPERIFVVYNGIEVEKFTPARADREKLVPGTSRSNKLIIIVANMHTAAKGHGDLIEAARTVRESCPEARFLLAGDGEMRAFLEDQVRLAGLSEAFAFLGHRTDIPELLSCCDIGVLASKSEGLPNAVLEYMAAGLPVIATAVGGVPEIIQNEVHGLLIPPENPAALTTAILRLMMDEELRKRLGRAGRERVQTRFTFSGLLASLTRAYETRSTPSGERPFISARSFRQADSGHGNLQLSRARESSNKAASITTWSNRTWLV